MRKKILSSLILFLTLFLLLSCQNNSSDNSNENENKNDRAKSYYPVKISDSLGRTVNIIAEPKRVVSLSPTMSEIICAIGKEDALVGRTSFCNYPEIVTKIDSVGDFYEPNMEKIKNLKPDLILMSSLVTKKTLAQLDENHLTYVLLDEYKSIAGAYTMIEKVGVALNAQEKSDEVIKNMKEKITYIQSKVKKANKPTVYIVVDFDYTGGKNTYLGEMIDMCGAKNAANDTDGWNYSVEQLVKNDPDILIAPERLFPQIETREGYKDLTAVKNNKYYDVNEDIFSRQGPRLVEGIEEMARIIHPELFKD